MASANVSVGSSEGILERARRASAAMSAGLLAGALVGGLGGRIAMLILRLTSDPNVRGLPTDDGFTIGVVSAATLFLVLVTALAGALGGLTYLCVRSWVPPRWRSWLYGALAAVTGGASVVRPGGTDFRLLEPLPLAVVMFIALPGIYGVLTSLLAERFLERSTFFRGSARSLAGLAVLLPVALFGIVGLSIVALVGVALVLGLDGLHLRWIRSSGLMIWLGRAGLAAAAVVGSIQLVRDVADVL